MEVDAELVVEAERTGVKVHALIRRAVMEWWAEAKDKR